MERDIVEYAFEKELFDLRILNSFSTHKSSAKDADRDSILKKRDTDWFEWADGLSGSHIENTTEEKEEETTIASLDSDFGINYNYFIGVIVDTEKVVAAVVNENGVILNQCEDEFFTWAPLPGYLEQSSDQIWEKVVNTIRTVKSDFLSKFIKGIAIIATSSLVILDEFGEPLSISPTLQPQHNVILWNDERATEEAEFINEVGGPPLLYCDNKITANYPLPKLLWIKKNLLREWVKSSYFLFLADFFTWKLTRSEIRNPGSLFCKWNMMMDHQGNPAWPEDFFKNINLYDITTCKWNEIGYEILESGSRIPLPILPDVAHNLGLETSTAVAVGMSISNARLLSLIGIWSPGISKHPINRLLITYGSSLTLEALSRIPNYVPHYHGPWFAVLLPGLWTNKGYQRCGDRLINYILNAYSTLKKLKNKFENRKALQEHLESILKLERKNRDIPMTMLTENLHICPEFAGNSCPLSDHGLVGAISGLSLKRDEITIAIIYLAAIQAFAYSTKLNLVSLQTRGFTEFDCVVVVGQEFKNNSLQQQVLADVLNMPVVIPERPESLCVNAAILAANAAMQSKKTCLSFLAHKMSGPAKVVKPQDKYRQFHEKKYQVYLQMIEDQKIYRELMK